MEGWVYILSHPAWAKLGDRGAVKIGKTGQNPSKRGLQIGSASGLIKRPKVEWCCWVADRGAVEKAVHQRLGRCRIHKRRELFAVDVETARAVIEASTAVRTVPLRRKVRRIRQRSWSGQRMQLAGILVVSTVLLALAYFR